MLPLLLLLALAGTLLAEPAPEAPRAPIATALPHPESLDGWRPAENLSAAWPFDRPSLDTLRRSERKVFAHYFTPYPLSLDNNPFGADSYVSSLLSPHAQGDKFLKYGGYIRDRPLPVGPWKSPDWLRRNMAVEITRARELGLDGFTVDILMTDGPLWTATLRLLDTAREIDPDFKIVLMPDMDAEFKKHPERLKECLLALASHPSVFRLADGRVVLSPFDAGKQTPEWWRDLFDQLDRQGVKIAFYPLFLGVEKYQAAYKPISEGAADWGPETLPEVEGTIRRFAAARAFMGHFMMPVSAQDVRPNSLWFRETENTRLLRTIWKGAIDTQMDWVQLVTWNDYCETTVVSPSLGNQYLFYDLSAYYLSWYKTGNAPPITRDALYYCHRSQIISPDYPPDPPEVPMRSLTGPIKNEIEVVGFLKEPGTLEIEIAGKTFRKDVPAGISDFSVPAEPGRPSFRLVRNQQAVIDLPSAWTIVAGAPIQDPVYRGGSSTRPAFLTDSPVSSAAGAP